MGDQIVALKFVFENALTIGKIAFFVAEFLDCFTLKIDSNHLFNTVLNLLSISSDIRNCTCTDLSWNGDQVFQSSSLMLNAVVNEIISIFSCSDLNDNFLWRFFQDFYSFDIDTQNNTIKKI